MLACRSEYLFSQIDTFQGYQTSVKQHLHRVQYSSFPPEGVTGTSSYRFEHNLHLIKIPSHLYRESIYMFMQCTIFHSTVPFQYSSLAIRDTLGGWAQRSLPTPPSLSGREGPVKETTILMQQLINSA